MTDDVRNLIRHLRAEGYTYRRIAGKVGVSKSTVSRTLSPSVAASGREASRRWKAANRERDLRRNREYHRQRRLGEPRRADRVPSPFERLVAERIAARDALCYSPEL